MPCAPSTRCATSVCATEASRKRASRAGGQRSCSRGWEPLCRRLAFFGCCCGVLASRSYEELGDLRSDDRSGSEAHKYRDERNHSSDSGFRPDVAGAEGRHCRRGPPQRIGERVHLTVLSDVFGEGESNGSGDPRQTGKAKRGCPRVCARVLDPGVSMLRLSRRAETRLRCAESPAGAHRPQGAGRSEPGDQSYRLTYDDEKTGPVSADVCPARRRECELDDVVDRERHQKCDVDDIKEDSICVREFVSVDLEQQEREAPDGENEQRAVGPLAPSLQALRSVVVMPKRRAVRQRSALSRRRQGSDAPAAEPPYRDIGTSRLRQNCRSALSLGDHFRDAPTRGETFAGRRATQNPTGPRKPAPFPRSSRDLFRRRVDPRASRPSVTRSATVRVPAVDPFGCAADGRSGEER